MLRFMRAYRESLDWMYSDPLAVKYYSETIKQPESLVVMQRDQYNPKEALSPDRLSDIDQVMADGIEMKFLERAAEQGAARGVLPDSAAGIVTRPRSRVPGAAQHAAARDALQPGIVTHTAFATVPEQRCTAPRTLRAAPRPGHDLVAPIIASVD